MWFADVRLCASKPAHSRRMDSLASASVWQGWEAPALHILHTCPGPALACAHHARRPLSAATALRAVTPCGIPAAAAAYLAPPTSARFAAASVGAGLLAQVANRQRLRARVLAEVRPALCTLVLAAVCQVPCGVDSNYVWTISTQLSSFLGVGRRIPCNEHERWKLNICTTTMRMACSNACHTPMSAFTRYCIHSKLVLISERLQFCTSTYQTMLQFCNSIHDQTMKCCLHWSMRS